MLKQIPASLIELQDQAFERIKADAKQYASTAHAKAIYVQEALFALNTSQMAEAKELQNRAEWMKEAPGFIILFPDELTDLRIRAAYHGAGLATESPENIPRPIKHHLSDNLENYPPKLNYEQLYFPWAYRFTVNALTNVLQHDFYIAASDSADGKLHELCYEIDDT